MTQIGLSFRTTNKDSHRSAVFQCDCGNIKVMVIRNVEMSLSKSCGCFRKEYMSDSMKTHNKSKTIEYNIWGCMLKRVRATSGVEKKNYVDRGITCCDRWLKFENFLEDMGPRLSSEHSIDRIDNNGNYCKENCRWATLFEQTQNVRSNLNLSFNGKTQCLAVWSRELKISFTTTYARLKRGWSIEKSLTHPVQARTKKV